MAGNVVASASIAVTPTLEGAQGELTKIVTSESEKAGTSGGKTLGDKLGSAFSGGLGKLKGAFGLMAAAIPVAAIGKGLLDIGATFDEMTDNIIIGTGASGDALADMEDQAKRVATTVPTTFGDAGQRVADLNTRLGLTGESLGDLAVKFEALESIGNGLDTMLATGALTAFGVAAEDMGAKLDYAWGVSQATGLGMNDLFSIVEKNAPALTNLGFSFEESANMAGLLDKAGMDAGGTMGKLSKALTELAEPGQSARDAFDNVLSSMQEYIDKGDTASAIDIASKVFGTKGAAQFVAAVQSGAMSLDQIGDSALGASGDIEGTMESTMDWPEKWQLVSNKIMEALEPLGSAVMDGLGSAVEHLSEMIDSVDPSVFDGIGEAVGNIATDGLDALESGLQWLMDNKEGISEFFTAVGNVAGGLGEALGIVAGALTDFYFWMKDVEADFGAWCDEVGPQIEEAFNGIGDFFAGIGEGVSGFCQGAQDAWNGLSETAGTAFGAISSTVQTDMNDAQSVASSASSALSAALSGDWDSAKAHAAEAFDTIRGNITGKLDAAKGPAMAAADAIGEKLGFPGLGDKVGQVFDSVRAFIQDPIGTAEAFIHEKVESILGFFSGLGNRITNAIGSIHFPQPSISWENLQIGPASIPIPHVSWHKRGGYFDGAQIIGIGEGGPEAALPLTSPFMDPFADAVADRMGERGTGGGVTMIFQNPVKTPAEFGREMRRIRNYGLAGAR